MPRTGPESKTRISADDVAALEHLQRYVRWATDVYGAAETSPPPQRRRRRLSERDLAKTITAHLKSGLGIARTETDPATGRFVVIAGSPEKTEIAPANEWDEVFNDGSH